MNRSTLILFLLLIFLCSNIHAQYNISAEDNVLTKKERDKLERVIDYQLDFYRKVFPEDSIQSSTVKLIIFNSYTVYLLYQKEQGITHRLNSFGFYSPKKKEAVVCKDKNKERFMETAYHEVSHFFTNTYFRNIPVWLNEGLAVYFAKLRVTTKKIAPEQYRYYTDKVKTMIKIRDINLNDFFTWRHQRFAKESCTNDSYGYAVAYAVVRFMIEKDKKLFINFIRQIKSGKSARESFEIVYPKGFEGFEKDFIQYYSKDN